VRLEVPDDNVMAGALQLLGVFEHSVGLSNTRRISKSILSLPLGFIRLLLLWKDPDIHAVRFQNQTLHCA